MDYKIEIDHQNKIIHYKHSGLINKEEIGAAWSEFLQLKEFTSQKYNLLSDYSKATFNMMVGDIDLIANFLLTLKEILNGKKQALVILESKSTAISLLFEGEVNLKIGFKVRTFSSKNEALKWLKG